MDEKMVTAKRLLEELKRNLRTPAEILFDEIRKRTLRPRPRMPERRRPTGLWHPLKFYSKAYGIPLQTIKGIRARYNPILLDCPENLLRILSNQPGPRVNLVNLENIVARKFVAPLKRRSMDA